jgi:hypothetical protein
MLPPIKRATRNADNILKDRGTSNAIPLWKNVTGKKKAERGADSRAFLAAKSEVDLLNLLKQFPGQSCKFYARRLPGRAPGWVRFTLQQYAEDGIVRNSRANKCTYIWYLND